MNVSKEKAIDTDLRMPLEEANEMIYSRRYKPNQGQGQKSGNGIRDRHTKVAEEEEEVGSM